MAESTLGDFERAAADAGTVHYVLRLFVAGASPRSLRATERVRALCAELLGGRHSLSVVDIYQQPALAKEAGVLGAPTLVLESPGPRRTLVGDMADRARVLCALGLATA